MWHYRTSLPAAGLARTHLASIKRLDHWERLSGEFTMDLRQEQRVWAQQSLAPLGMCWRVGVHICLQDGRKGWQGRQGREVIEMERELEVARRSMKQAWPLSCSPLAS